MKNWSLGPFSPTRPVFINFHALSRTYCDGKRPMGDSFSIIGSKQDHRWPGPVDMPDAAGVRSVRSRHHLCQRQHPFGTRPDTHPNPPAGHGRILHLGQKAKRILFRKYVQTAAIGDGKANDVQAAVPARFAAASILATFTPPMAAAFVCSICSTVLYKIPVLLLRGGVDYA